MSQPLFRLSDHDLRGLAAAIRSHRIAPPWTALALQRLLPSSVCDDAAAEFRLLAEQGLSGDPLAAMLEFVVGDREQRRAEAETIELVTSGPEGPGITNRETSVVLRGLFAQAESSVLVAGYAVYQGQRVFQALADRMQQVPALRVRMFLDIQRPYGDTTMASLIVRRFAERFRTEQWPADRPLPNVYYDPRSLDLDMERRACLHAKCVVLDRQHVYVSSANFTEAAQERNIEVGLLVRSRRLAAQLTSHFDSLLDAGFLAEIFRA
jgi:phosphatidylserine/phosphatidylglycerophosphate/cardiolipin synthase-like enzyme